MTDRSSAAMDVIRAWNDKLRSLPPVPRAILLNHRVPYGRMFRQWDTNGDLWLWMHPNEITELPRRKAPEGVLALSGIPVRYR